MVLAAGFNVRGGCGTGRGTGAEVCKLRNGQCDFCRREQFDLLNNGYDSGRRFPTEPRGGLRNRVVFGTSARHHRSRSRPREGGGAKRFVRTGPNPICARRGIEIYQELVRKIMASKPKPESNLSDAFNLSTIDAAMSALHRRDRPEQAAELDTRRLELWRHWDRKLPGNGFVRRQLESELVTRPPPALFPANFPSESRFTEQEIKCTPFRNKLIGIRSPGNSRRLRLVAELSAGGRPKRRTARHDRKPNPAAGEECRRARTYSLPAFRNMY